jgi:tRNA (mo5U34)-methyltransferase
MMETSSDIETIERLVASVKWHHDWEILPGLRTRGSYDPAFMLAALGLPDDMTGMTVADVGASNGFFSFALRARGAKVTAFDYRHEDNSGFGLARRILGIDDIVHHHGNVSGLDPSRHGVFDVVLALGLLYHTADPFTALSRVAGLSKSRLFVESYCDPSLTGQEARFIPDCGRFTDSGTAHGDRSNFWCFSPSCLRAMVEDVGFSILREDTGGDRTLLEAVRTGNNAREGLAFGVMARDPVGADPMDPASWRIF